MTSERSEGKTAGVPGSRSIARHAGGAALAAYGGLAWIGCLVGGVLIGSSIHDWPDDGTTTGGSHGLAAAFVEIAVSTLVLLVLAYGLFAWLLSRQDDHSTSSEP